MQMYFEAAYKANLLFEGWNTKTVGVFVMALIYEGLKYFR